MAVGRRLIAIMAGDWEYRFSLEQKISPVMTLTSWQMQSIEMNPPTANEHLHAGIDRDAHATETTKSSALKRRPHPEYAVTLL